MHLGTRKIAEDRGFSCITTCSEEFANSINLPDTLLRTVFGKVRWGRQRVYCNTCRQWVTPLNAALGLHDTQTGRSTWGFRSLVSLCGMHRPYRSAQQLVREITQDGEVVSVRQVESIVDAEGDRLRQEEEAAWHEVAYDVIREIQDRKVRAPTRAGKLYMCIWMGC